MLPLSLSEYTVKSDFITHIKGQNIPNNFKLISFDVTSFFTNVLLDFTIDVILKRIYDENQVKTKQQMIDLLLLCTKNVHFSYNGDIYTQRYGVAMDLPLGPVLASIFMVILERTKPPTLREHMSPWKRYVDDTISYIKEEFTEHVLSKLNGYHDNIEFTYKIENEGKLLFLDILVILKITKLRQQYTIKVPTMTYIFTGSRFPKQNGNEGRYRH